MIANWFYDVHEWVICLAIAIAFSLAPRLAGGLAGASVDPRIWSALVCRGVEARENPVR